MQIYINHKNGVPAWRQIVNQVKQLVATGVLQEKDRLPSVRALAKELSVNPITTARAYRELEAEGITRNRKGAGTFVAATPVHYSDDEVRRRLKPHVDELLVLARQLGLDMKALSDLLRERDDTLFSSRKES